MPKRAEKLQIIAVYPPVFLILGCRILIFIPDRILAFVEKRKAPRRVSNFQQILYSIPMKNRAAYVSCVLVALCACFSIASAMPPHKSLLQRISKQEQARPYYLEHEREIRGRGVDQPVRTRTIDELRQRSLDENIRIIALLVQFTDHLARTDSSFFDRLLFADSTGTLRHFYSEVSYGNLTLVTVNLPSSMGWMLMPETYAYYVSGNNGFGEYPENAQGLTEAAVLAADPIVDFSQYDNNGDGVVDGLFVIHSGPGAEMTGNSNDIWSHMWSVHTPPLVDGVSVQVYSMEPEYWSRPRDMTCGVYAHEMGHSMFGLPDLYDYDYDSNGLGDWTLMASGSWNGRTGNSPAHPDAWCLTTMGIVDPINITVNTSGVSIPSVDLSPTIYRLWTNGDLGPEYFLVENRRQIGYDAAIPGEGMMVYHVDETVHGNNSQWYPGHTDAGHYEVALEQADGSWDLEQESNPGDMGDPFPGTSGRFAFSNSSIPNSRSYNGVITRVAIRNISLEADTMTADFAVRPGAGNYVALTLPDTTGVPGRVVRIPMMIDTITGQNITSFDFVLHMNSDLMVPAAPYFDRQQSIIPPSWTVTSTHTMSTVSVHGSGATPLEGFGELISLSVGVDPVAQAGSTSLLTFQSITFNSGTPGADPTNGSVRIVVPQLRVMPEIVNFGAVRPGQSFTRSILASNAGETPVSVDSVTVAAPFTTNFTERFYLTQPSSWHAIRITFAPMSIGSFADTLIIYSDGIDAPYPVVVTGQGALPAITVNPTQLSFDTVVIGTTLVRGLTINDTGRVNLIISDARFVRGERFTFIPAPLLPDTVPARGFVNFSIQFAPVAGLCEDTLIIYHDAGDSVRVPVRGVGGTSAVGDPDQPALPADFSLSPAFPNPFNPSTSMTIALPQTAPVTLRVYDTLGRLVDTPLSGTLAAGYHTVGWDCPSCGSGLYLFVLTANNLQLRQKALLIR
jgi:immune inhibitor A